MGMMRFVRFALAASLCSASFSVTLSPTGKSFNHCPGWGRYVAEDVVGGRYLALHGCNAGFGWIDLGGDAPCEIGYSRVNTCGQGRPTPPQMPRFRPILHPRRYKTNRRL